MESSCGISRVVYKIDFLTVADGIARTKHGTEHVPYFRAINDHLELTEITRWDTSTIYTGVGTSKHII